MQLYLVHLTDKLGYSTFIIIIINLNIMWRGPYIGCPTCLTYAPGPETSFYTAQQKMSSRTDYFRGGPIFSENFSPRTNIFRTIFPVTCVVCFVTDTLSL